MTDEPKLNIRPLDPSTAGAIEMMAAAELQAAMVRMVDVTHMSGLSIMSAMINVMTYNFADIDKQAAADYFRALAQGIEATNKAAHDVAVQRSRVAFEKIGQTAFAKMQAMQAAETEAKH